VCDVIQICSYNFSCKTKPDWDERLRGGIQKKQKIKSSEIDRVDWRFASSIGVSCILLHFSFFSFLLFPPS
jgi:hypothetical protein